MTNKIVFSEFFNTESVIEKLDSAGVKRYIGIETHNYVFDTHPQHHVYFACSADRDDAILKLEAHTKAGELRETCKGIFLLCLVGTAIIVFFGAI